MTKTKSRNGRTNRPNPGPRSSRTVSPAGADERIVALADLARDLEDEATSGAGASSPSVFTNVSDHGGWYRWALGWFVCSAVAWVHLGSVNWLNYNLSTDSAASYLVFAAILAPAIVTAWKIPSSRAGWWRWLALYCLLALTVGESAMVVLLVGEAALLHRWWVSERRYGFSWAPRGDNQ